MLEHCIIVYSIAKPVVATSRTMCPLEVVQASCNQSSKSSLNGPFHGMMHLQTPCSPAISPLILQVVITGIPLSLSGSISVFLRCVE